jgi:hypothetical protein
MILQLVIQDIRQARPGQSHTLAGQRAGIGVIRWRQVERPFA